MRGIWGSMLTGRIHGKFNLGGNLSDAGLRNFMDKTSVEPASKDLFGNLLVEKIYETPLSVYAHGAFFDRSW
jgi:hypothetical protein